MPLARIITRSTEESQEVAAQLRARGFEVEMALPGNVPARPADLELRVEECAPEEALRRAGALSGSEDLCVYIAPGAIAGLRPIAVIPFLPELLREKAPITDSVTASAQPEASVTELSEVNISEADAKIAPATADVPEVVLTEAVSSEIQSAELVPELSDAVIDRLEIFVPELSEAGAEIASAEADGAEIEAAEVVHEGFTQMADPSVASTQTEVFVSELHESEFSELVLAEAGLGEATAEDGSAEARHALITQSSERNSHSNCTNLSSGRLGTSQPNQSCPGKKLMCLPLRLRPPRKKLRKKQPSASSRRCWRTPVRPPLVPSTTCSDGARNQRAGLMCFSGSSRPVWLPWQS